jgi:hypothetical protein
MALMNVFGGKAGVSGSVNAGPISATTQDSASAAFGPAPGPSGGHGRGGLAPSHPAGAGFWFSVGCVVGLIVIYHSLPG